MVRGGDAKARRGGRRRKPAKRGKGPTGLRVIRRDVAGIDLGANEHWVCGPTDNDEEANVERFGTTTPQLERLVQWLVVEGVTSVAMESTSVYWIPVYELLEANGIEAVLVNAHYLRSVPGRKSDIIDCQWTQKLHSCGLLKGSFRPNEAICQLRALQRERANLVGERSRVVQRMQKALDQMNVQVHRAVTDMTGKTGLSIVRAIVAGERDPNKLALLRDARCKKSAEEIAEHLTGTWRREHLFNLEMGLRSFDHLEAMIFEYDAKLREWIEELQPPERRGQNVPAHPNRAKEKAIRARGDQDTRNALWRLTGVDLTRIDGISSSAAQTVLTEVGLDLHAFPDEHHFVAWLRLSPRTAITGGKPLRKKRNGTGATRVAGVLRMAATSLRNSKTALGAYFRAVARRKDYSVAIFATARKLATLIYRMLHYTQDYVDEGAAIYEARFQRRRLNALHASAQELGYVLVPASDAA